MKQILYLVFATLLLVSCGGKEESQPAVAPLEGCWELMDVSSKSARIGDVQVSVFIRFSASDFTLCQKLGEALHYTVFTGTYVLDGETLTGKYSDGTSFGPYSVKVGDGIADFISGDKEVDHYRKVEKLPID